jgi:hypothetical protein
LGNDGIHRIDYCRFVMGLEGMPQAICCSGGKFFFEDDQEWPDTELVTYEYPDKILQYEMRLWSRPKLFGITEGAAVYGENGWVLLTNNAWKAYDGANAIDLDAQLSTANGCPNRIPFLLDCQKFDGCRRSICQHDFAQLADIKVDAPEQRSESPLRAADGQQ